MILRSFGCSFIYGTELSSSLHSWPALMAQKLGIEYVCHATPGAGNLQIMESILQHADSDDIFIINWTWIDRFDFVNSSTEKWETLRPALDHDHADYYFRNLHGQYRDMLTNLIYVKTALDCLCQSNRTFIMTAMDSLLFETVKKEWHDPSAVSYLQKQIKPSISDFDGKNFLDWSKDRGYPISELWHPLEQAHRHAADFWIPALSRLIYK